ncbi:hypothetical protein [Chelativorans xinjiangense]|uniref:hypothetical protein n=1 Tax=Chelativorans xinjiangense TaxID=2681485 RepID=UPI00135729FD|nr:hypothetical protein [Chelativorans xinjiangense]
MLGGLLGGGLGGLGGVLGTVTGTVDDVREAVVDTGNGLSSNFGSALSLTGNVLGESGIVDDLINNLGEGDLTGAVAEGYADVFALGGVINNLADGHGLGVEGLLGTALGTVDGVTGPGGGLLDGLLG